MISIRSYHSSTSRVAVKNSSPATTVANTVANTASSPRVTKSITDYSKHKTTFNTSVSNTVGPSLLKDVCLNNYIELNLLQQLKVDIKDYRYSKCLLFIKNNPICVEYKFKLNQVVFIRKVSFQHLILSLENEMDQIKSQLISNTPNVHSLNALVSKYNALNTQLLSAKSQLSNYIISPTSQQNQQQQQQQ